MSKIQKALDKIKKEQLKKSTDSASFKLDSTSLAESDEISDMHQPEEMPSNIRRKKRIIDSLVSDQSVFNAFRELRTSVIQKVKESSPIIMVTSCVYGGGSSFVAKNLATAIAMDETKTALLVDCNLSNPTLDDLPVFENHKVGLKEYLKNDNCSVNEIIHPTGIKHLRVIPAGSEKTSSSEWFTSVRLHRLFEEIKQRYSQRYIIVDAPTISDNADARILAEVCDHVILVVPYGKVTSDQILKSARSIGKEKLLGTVFNNEPSFPKLAWK